MQAAKDAARAAEVEQAVAAVRAEMAAEVQKQLRQTRTLGSTEELSTGPAALACSHPSS